MEKPRGEMANDPNVAESEETVTDVLEGAVV
jgi:hypothetical protein